MEQIFTFLSPFIPGAAFLAFLMGDAFSDAFRFREVLKKFGAFKKVVGEHATGGLSTPFKTAEEITRETILRVLTPNTQWHRWQAVRQASMIILAAWAYQSLPALALFASSFWLVHDGIVNLVGLDRSFWFVGTTAWIDRMFQKTGHPELFMGIAKIGFIAFSIMLLFLS